MQFVVDDVKNKTLAGKAVMNMSLGGSFSAAINSAIKAIFDAGIVPIVAAGNENVSGKLNSYLMHWLTTTTARYRQHLPRICAPSHYCRCH